MSLVRELVFVVARWEVEEGPTIGIVRALITATHDGAVPSPPASSGLNPKP